MRDQRTRAMLSVKVSYVPDSAKRVCLRAAIDALGRGVLTDMAMHEPHPWIIGFECNGQVASPR